MKGLDDMLKSCPYCGRIHDTRFDCGKKPATTRWHADTQASAFRRTNKWKVKSKAIRDRDHGMCQICIRDLYNTDVKYNGENVSVHHAIPIEQNPDKALDDDNLITLCEKHHEMAECGAIPY
ncbi:MAG: HNH endonuclease, partial [Bacteroidales bacterium]|nr:HNH endonuclease [Bacteroidales bacterium]